MLDRILPLGVDKSMEGLVEELIRRSSASSVRELAEALGAEVKHIEPRHGLLALCLRKDDGYSILTDLRESPDIIDSHIAHEIGHIMADNFGRIGYNNEEAELFCDEFAEVLLGALKVDI
ncbi:MAG: hypothetical protein R3346_04165 [Candidatus Spechtbacterales bacterium]|nr:hypothetical protein [Candidatus Spechtbacterales bacterium]